MGTLCNILQYSPLNNFHVMLCPNLMMVQREVVPRHSGKKSAAGAKKVTKKHRKLC